MHFLLLLLIVTTIRPGNEEIRNLPRMVTLVLNQRVKTILNQKGIEMNTIQS